MVKPNISRRKKRIYEGEGNTIERSEEAKRKKKSDGLE